jgi:hypothetical protein
MNSIIIWDVMFGKVKHKITDILMEHVNPSSGSKSKLKKATTDNQTASTEGSV